MSEEVIAWLRSEEGEEWSRARSQSLFYTGGAPVMAREPGPVDASEDPTGRPPLPARQAAASEGTA